MKVAAKLYRCVRRCYHQKKLWEIGELAQFTGDPKAVPRHFEKVTMEQLQLEKEFEAQGKDPHDLKVEEGGGE